MNMEEYLDMLHRMAEKDKKSKDLADNDDDSNSFRDR
jgi:hypothetical protein